MTDKDIVMDWMQHANNLLKLPKMNVDKKMYNFIVANSPVIQSHDVTVYAYGGTYIRLIKDYEPTT